MSESMMTLHEAATALHLTLPAEDARFERVTTDSRSIQAGDLFVALAGEQRLVFDADPRQPPGAPRGRTGG